MIIVRQAGVEVLKRCTCFHLGSETASLSVRIAEVELPSAKTVEFPCSLLALIFAKYCQDPLQQMSGTNVCWSIVKLHHPRSMVLLSQRALPLLPQ